MKLPSKLSSACGTFAFLLITTVGAHHDDECAFNYTLNTYISDISSKYKTYVNPPPPLQPGEMSQLHWGDDGKPVHEFAYRIGLPKSLRTEVLDYAERLGIINVIKSLVMTGGENANHDLNEKVQEDGNRLITMENGNKWYFNRPGEHFQLKSNQWWADPADERGHEDMLKVLAKGEFDTVLKALGNKFDHINGLAVQGIGFIAVSHCVQHHFHFDFDGREKKAFGILVPILLGEEDKHPSQRQPELVMETRYSDGTAARGEVNYEYDAAFMTGDGLWHSTNTVDYRDTNGMRLTLSVFVADVTENLVDGMAADETALYVQDQADWLYAQRGRHWTRPETGIMHTLKEDRGRKAFDYQDQDEACEDMARDGGCDANAREMYKNCPASCGVFMDENDYSNMIKGSLY